MYTRRKVFSLGEGNIDYDYNIYQKLYSEAFEDGVDYTIEKMFAEGTDESAKKDNIFNRAWKKVRDDWWEKGQGWRDEATNDAGEKVKKINWKRAGKRAGIIAVPTAAVAVPTALAIRHHNKKKAEAEAEN